MNVSTRLSDPASPSHPPAIEIMTPLLSPRPLHPAKSPSPNYFSFQNDGGSFLNDSPRHAKNNWSPPSSTVRSTAAASPTVVPLDQRPEFDAFRQQSESKAFNLHGLNTFRSPQTPSHSTKDSTTARASSRSLSRQDSNGRPRTAPRDVPGANYRASLDPSTAELSRSPKRMLSPGADADNARRHGPPPHYPKSHDREQRMSDSPPSIASDTSRFSLPLDKLPAFNTNNTQLNGQSSHGAPKRAETLPASKQAAESSDLATAQHIINLIDSRAEDILLLDLRVSTQYATSHVTGALSLCIPTTLLKRPSFDVERLANTFKDEDQRRRFEHWRKSSHIIVYDSHSSQLKDATMCINTINKFRSEGYEGTLYIIKGGFAEISRNFPAYIENGMDSDTSSRSSVSDSGPDIAPVIGGCPMPSSDQPANPFFGNIRQNMDLIGGVGRIPLQHPAKANRSTEEAFPTWLKDAANDSDQGLRVSNKFEQIERREKKRMEEALSGKVAWGTPKQEIGGSVQIAGLEKGAKNRYNNIWPFEHSRVKLQGVASSECDYFNASYIQSSRSNKRYISTQAPIPATFNDFWNVIWQQDIRVIVMLTAEKEGAQVKAHNYWSEKQYGPLQLEFLSEKRASLDLARISRRNRQSTSQRPGSIKRSSTILSTSQLPLAPLDDQPQPLNTNTTTTTSSTSSPDQPYVIVRKFTLKHSRHPFDALREITQLQYSSWPDFGAPAHPAHLLGLVEQCDAVVRATNRTHSRDPEPPSTRPVLVHCSAGCGRTGTFCTVDSVIDMLKRQRLDRADGKGEGTAMEIDGGKCASGGAGAGGASASTGGAAGGDFFSSRNHHHHNDEGIDGAWVDRDDVDLVEKTVEDFRHQRISMVQSLRQYVLCYESVMEWLVEQKRREEEVSA